MPVRSAARAPGSLQAILLTGVSALALLAASPAPARALPLYSARGGGASATANAAAAALAGSQQAQAIGQQMTHDLLRAALAIQSVQQAQIAARAVAHQQPSGVANGLAPGGLVVDPRVIAGSDANLWVNANAPVQTVSNGQTLVTVRQTAQRAVTTWQSFNVGQNTTLDFDQSQGNTSNGNNWVMLSRIDATGVPSQIEGQIKADGTVLIINPNGIVFSGTSQINVHTLIASTLDIDGFSGGGVANVGVFGGTTGGSYIPVQINGVTQTTPGDTAILAPPNEDSANQAFLSSGLYANGTTANGGGTLVMAQGITSGQANQGIIVAPGAQISTNISGFDNGGYVALLSTSVDNAGSISTPSGQVVLAASPDVFLNEPGGTNTAIGVSSLINQTATLVFDGVALPGGSPATNEAGGLLSADDGNVTIFGDIVNQSGAVAATTSVTRAGSVTYSAFQQLNLGAASLTSILPDENGETIPENSLSAFVGPSINIAAANVDMQGNANGQPGALIIAPSAAMTVSTGVPVSVDGSLPNTSVTNGQFLQESGSTIDLAGLSAAASIRDYIFTFKVTANDVADSPLAQNLIGQTVTIDLTQSGTRSDGLTWVGSPLFSATGAGDLGDVPQSLDQLLTKGGSLAFEGPSSASNVRPFNNVIQAPGSLVDVSGGFTNFAGAKVATTELLAASGEIFNIADADPFLAYVGIAGRFVVDHPHWGITETFSSPLIDRAHFDPGFIAGASAGALSIIAGNPILEGTLLGATVTGSQQAELAESDTGPGGSQATINQLPQDASLTISLVTGLNASGSAAVVLQSDAVDVLGPDFGMNSTLALPTETIVTGTSAHGPTTTVVPVITYSTDALSASELGSIVISGASELSMSQGATLTVQAGGSIKLDNVTTIDGALTAHGGSISLTGFTGAAGVFSAPPVSQVTIGPDAVLDVSGLFINDAGASFYARQGDAHINGGSVTIQTDVESNSTSLAFNGGTNIPPVVDVTQSIVLAQGSMVDVSSGGYVQPNGQIKSGPNGLPAGNGGNLSLITYANANWANPEDNFEGAPPGNIAPTDGNRPDAANVFMDSTIFSAGLNDGGTFTLQVPIVQVGGVDSVTSSSATGTVALPGTFFSENGFSAYSLTSTYGSTIVLAGTNVPLRQQNYLLDPHVALPASGARVRDFAALGLAPFGMRDPVSLTLAETPFPYGGTNDVSTKAGVTIEAGATIEGEPGASIDLTAAGPVTVLGSLIAPGGSITLDNNGAPVNLTQLAQGQDVGVGTQAPLDVWVGANAVLNVDGAFVPDLVNPLLSTGAVLNGGSITLEGGTVVALPGSQFDLAGTSAIIQNLGLIPRFSRQIIEQPIWSNGGTLTITGSTALARGTSGEFQAAYFDGTIDAAGGAAQASGGTLTIGDRQSLYGAIVIPQGGDVTTAFRSAAIPATAAQLAAMLPTTGSIAEISANTLNDSGFDSVNLMATTIGFSGNVSVKVPDQLTLAGNLTLLKAGDLNASDTAASIGATLVSIEAGDLLLASNSLTTSPTLSDGTLNLDASAQIDLAGYMSVSNAASVNLMSGGDIRLLSDTDAEFASGIFGEGGGSYFGALIGFLSFQTSQSIVQSPGVMAVPNDLTLTAREVFPTSNSAFLLMSTGLGSGAMANTITIASNGEAPAAPLSIGGEIVVDAANIVQDGALEAPLGTIDLGLSAGQQFPAVFSTNVFTLPKPVTTQSVILGNGSLTSVSAAGLDIPFGTTVNDTNFSTVGSNILDSESGGTANPALTAPPAKSIQLNGASIDSESGAVLDLSGGGDFFATEFVPGSGGSHNVLTEIGGQPVFALVPSFEAPVAPNDPTLNAVIAPGSTVTLPGGNGIAAGTYVLLPAIYATMPGAFRVVVTATNTALTNADFVEPDGSILMAGTLGNGITGARSSSTALLEIQSQAVWSKYSEIDKTSANTFFTKLAATNGAQPPLLPIDAGQLVIGATSALTLLGTNDFTPAPGGRGGEADITGTNILVLAPDQTEAAAEAAAAADGISVPVGGFIVLNSDQISDLGAESILIGGVRSQESDGSTLITPTASDVVIDTDTAHPLSAPDLLVVANPVVSSSPSNNFVNVSNDFEAYAVQIPAVATGTGRISVLPGSVVEAKGAVASVQPQTLHIGSTVAPLPSTLKQSQLENYYVQGNTDAAGAYVLSDNNPVTQFYDQAYSGGGLAALLEVSNGQPSTVERALPTVPSSVTTIGGGRNGASNYTFTPPPLSIGSISVGTSAVLAGGNDLNLNGGDVALANTAALSGRNVFLGASVINLGNAPATAAGLTLTPSVIAQFAGSESVTLTSGSVFNLYDANGVSLGNADNPIGTLVLDGAGLFSAGGTTTVTADNVTLTDSQATPNPVGGLTSTGGTLIVDATAGSTGTLTLSAGQVQMSGEGQVDLNAAGQIVFAGNGGVNTGAAAVTLQAPDVVAAVGSVQSLATTGLLTLMPGESAAANLSPFDIGGSLSLTGGSINDAGAITALGGSVTLTATSGDVLLAQGADISATGSHIVLFNVAEDAPGGTVKLIADSGNVIIDKDATVDVSAAGDGFAGSLTIQTPRTAMLDGTLRGDAAFGDLGGNLTLNAGALAGSFLFTGFGGSLNFTLQQGNIDIGAATILISNNVTLTANAGSVIVDGAIDASGPNGGSIQLFGATGVSIDAGAVLIAAYQADNPRDPNFGNGESTLVQTGGTIELGTTGTPIANSYNSQFGYENVGSSGAINVAQGAIFDVSGGAGGANINNAGGAVIVRAPILTDNNVNLSFKGTVITSANGGPSGEGVVLDAYAVWSTTDQTSESAGQHFDGIIDPAGWFSDTNANTKLAGTTVDGDIFTPNTPNNDHKLFYQTTLVDFVQNPFNSAAIASDFAGASGIVLGSTLHLRPEIDLINPTPASGAGSINGGNITVASNWNLGAGTFSGPNGSFVPTYRTIGGADAGEPGVLMLAAANNVQINATISDGFYEPSDPFSTVQVPNGSETLSAATGSFNVALLFDETNFTNPVVPSGEPGMPAGAVTSPPGAASFPPGWNLADEEVYYGKIYNAYTLALSSLGGKSSQNIATNPAADFRTVGASGMVFDNNPADYVSYAAYVAAFNANYVGSGSVAGEPAAVTSFSNNPSSFSSYASYLTAYDNYAAALKSFSKTFYKANPTGFVPPPLVPLPPSAFGSATETGANGYFSDYQNYITAYQDYNGAQVEPGNVTVNSATAHSADSLLLVAMPFLPAPADTPNVMINVTPQAAGPGNAIANNPAMNGTLADVNTTSAASLMTAAISGEGSFSYNFVAGAQFTASDDLAADPDTVIAVPAGVVTSGASPSDSVTVNGHTTYTNPNLTVSTNEQIDVPTLVRTGTGSIDIVAAGSVEMLDATAPGAIYTAGAATDPVAGFDGATPPLITNLSYKPTGLIGDPAWGVGGGPVSVVAGDDIVGIETPVDSNGKQTGTSGTPTGEFWSAWYYVSGDATGSSSAPFDPSQGGIQNSTWVNYGTFFQGVGALGGGNVNLKAGADIDDISASLPETIEVSGGQSAGSRPVAHFFGGGDLTVEAGGNLNSSTFYVGRGTGTITVGGVVEADPDNPVTGAATQLIPFQTSGALGSPVALPLLLAVQDGFITVNADQGVTLGAVFDPTRIIFDTVKLGNALNIIGSASVPAGLGATFDSFGPDSGIALNSTAGNVELNALKQPDSNGSGVTDSLFTDSPPGSTISDGGGESDSIAPATVEASALTGNITLENNMFLTPSPTGTVNLQARGSISTLTTLEGQPSLNEIVMIDGFALPTTTTPQLFNMLGTPTPASLSQALHADDPVPDIVYAGDDITGSFDFIKPTQMEAGQDIINTDFIGQNNNPTDNTSIIAGRDIQAQDTTGDDQTDTSTFLIYGPGTFLIDAGRNLGPFFSGVINPASESVVIYGSLPSIQLPTGIFTVGDGSNLGSAGVKPYLQPQGANTFALFGTGPGIDDQAAIREFINPANAGSDQGIDFRPSIAQQLGQQLGQEFSRLVMETAANALDEDQLNQLNQRLNEVGLAPIQASNLRLLANLTDAARNNGMLTQAQLGQLATLNSDLSKSGIQPITEAELASPTISADFSLTSDEAIGLFQTLDTALQDLLVNRAFLDLLTNVTQDFNNPASPTFKNANQAYAAIGVLFPASEGFTNDNVSPGSSPVMVHTGDLFMAHSLLETQTGGDINIIGPGGNITVGANATDNSLPSQEGILTLQGGSIRTFTDGSVIVDQSRIFTEQGGDIDMFSANGDLNAGKGPKSSASFPPLELICDVDGFCRVNPTGLVTGAGIGALLSVPEQNPLDSNVNLAAPHGIIDAGAAGIRVAGNLNLVALQVLNAFNIDVGGVAIGVPTAASPNTGALTAATNAAGAAQASVPAPAQHASVEPSILIVEIEGYGGDDESEPIQAPQPEQRHKGHDQQSYNPNSAFDILGAGDLTDGQMTGLTESEKRRLTDR